MADKFDLDFDPKEVEGQRAPGNIVEPGVYDVKIKKAFIRKTDKGAEMLEIAMDEKNGKEIFYSTAIVSRAGKSTYERDGKHYPLPGAAELVAINRLLTQGDDILVKKGKVEFKGNTIDAKILTEYEGKHIVVGIRHEENPGYGPRINVVQWMNPDGTNEKGDEVLEKVIKSIERNPIKKSKAAQNVAPEKEQKDLEGSGW